MTSTENCFVLVVDDGRSWAAGEESTSEQGRRREGRNKKRNLKCKVGYELQNGTEPKAGRGSVPSPAMVERPMPTFIRQALKFFGDPPRPTGTPAQPPHTVTPSTPPFRLPPILESNNFPILENASGENFWSAAKPSRKTFAASLLSPSSARARM
jgi:hypothetical protein